MDRGLNELLKWGIENASAADSANDPSAAPPTNRGLNPEALAALFGGPSDADLMKASMAVITSRSAEQTLENRLVAFDNFEQLVESLDNANLLARLELWAPLLGVLDSDEPELRRMAAWCVGTAVQNNEPSQERLLAMGGVEPLLRLAAAANPPPPAREASASESDEDKTNGTTDGTVAPAPETNAAVRRKAIYALSSACRNYQPAMDACLAALEALDLRTRVPALAALPAAIDATNMDAVDELINGLKADVAAAEAAASAASVASV